MSHALVRVPRPVAFGAVLALLSILFGFGLGGAFGANEDAIKKNLADKGAAVLDSVYQGDAAKKDAVVSKSFQYLIRAHLHGGAIGTAALAAIAILILVSRLGLLAQASSVAFGLGALLYAFFWLRAGLLAPELGSTGAAKEALQYLAVPGAGLSMLGLLGTIITVAKDALFGTPAPKI